MTIGKALLSPTRTYAPILVDIFSRFRQEIAAIIHNTGGGQTKCLHFGEKIQYLKNNLFPTPQIFSIIQKSANLSWKEMYQVFNMGNRLEILCDESIASEIIQIAKKYKVASQIIGQCETARSKNEVLIQAENGNFSYHV